MSRCFEKIRLNTLEIPNRFVRSATYEGLATEDGVVSPALVAAMETLARGQVGLLLTGHACITPEGRASGRQLALYDDGFIRGLRRMTGAVHDAGGLIMAQLGHAGGFADAESTGRQALAPSAEPFADRPVRSMDEEDIDTLVQAMADGARRAREAGFDGVQVHSAHAYLLSQFLSPHFNRRQDAYGGSAQNRCRLLRRVLTAIRAATAPDFPLLVKLNATDWLPDGITPEDAAYAARCCVECGADGVELSGGRAGGPPSQMPARIMRRKGAADEAWYADTARRCKTEMGAVPLILVGGMRSLEKAEEVLAQGAADMIAFSRPLIREPELPARWQSGDTSPAACISCNACYGPIRINSGFYCPVAEKAATKG